MFPLLLTLTLLLLLPGSLAQESGGGIERGAFVNGAFQTYPKASTTRCASPDVQFQSLTSIYTQLGGDSWNRNWNVANTCPCIHNWPGVTCDSQGRITNLDLSANNLNGTIPSAFVGLENLRALRLDDNPHLRGPIPTFFAKLTQMEELFLHNTGLNGTVPGAVANLRRLTMLFVDAPNSPPRIPSTLSRHKQVFPDSPFAATNEERVPPTWLGSLQGVDQSQAAKTVVNENPSSGEFAPYTYNPSYVQGSIKVPPP
eukprot:g6596.t1